jgi:hypothetical protein
MNARQFSLKPLLVTALAFCLCAQAHALPAPPAPPALTATTNEPSYPDLPARHPSQATNLPSSTEPAAPATPRELFNAGTKQLRGGKLREAEASLESALASQRPALQPVALHNLGHVRFGQGIEEWKGPPADRLERANAGAQI